MVTITRRVVTKEPGRFAGWPANYGMWAWGDEVAAVFVVGWTGPLNSIHLRDVTQPFEPVVARTRDRGDTWSLEPFTGRIPGGMTTLNGDEHVVESLRVGPRLREEDFVPLDQPIDFLDPEMVVLCARTDLATPSTSWFHVGHERGRRWSGPHRLPDFGLSGVSARTDVVPLGHHSALFLLSGTKPDGGEGWAFSTRTDDGGLTFGPAHHIGPCPDGWAIMPSSLRLPGGRILTALRCSGPTGDGRPNDHWIDLYSCDDEGDSWQWLARPVVSTGGHGNPPSMARLADGTLVIHYGHRDTPQGLRAVTSVDDGHTWSEPLVLTSDTASLDMGYPRSVALDDGEVLAIFYTNDDPDSERFVEAVRWRPGTFSNP